MGAIYQRLDFVDRGALLVPVLSTKVDDVLGTRTNGLCSCAITRTVAQILTIERVIHYFDARFWLRLRTAHRFIATTHLQGDICEISQGKTVDATRILGRAFSTLSNASSCNL